MIFSHWVNGAARASLCWKWHVQRVQVVLPCVVTFAGSSSWYLCAAHTWSGTLTTLVTDAVALLRAAGAELSWQKRPLLMWPSTVAWDPQNSSADFRKRVVEKDFLHVPSECIACCGGLTPTCHIAGAMDHELTSSRCQSLLC